MSEKSSQSNPEKQPTTYLVRRSNGEIQPGTLTNRSKIKHVLQSNGTYVDLTLLEVAFPKIVADDGEEAIPTRFVPEFALSSDFQATLAAQLEGRSEEVNSYDSLLSADYNERDHSVEGAAVREVVTESQRQEMLAYADVALSAALRNDTDLQKVIESAFMQAGLQLPHEKEDLINVMRTDAHVRTDVQQYLREKAEYYRSDLPRRVREGGDKRPNYPGGIPEPALDVATKYAVNMITGEWNQSREDGDIQRDVSGNVILGQFRDAARIILTSPRMKGNK